jgi:hypothetical protein
MQSRLPFSLRRARTALEGFTARRYASAGGSRGPKRADADSIFKRIVRFLRAGGVDTEPQPLASEDDFEAFIRGCSLWAVRPAEGGRSRRTKITSLASALRALQTDGTYLLLREPFESMAEDVSNLKRHRLNASLDFEELANKADERLRER